MHHAHSQQNSGLAFLAGAATAVVLGGLYLYGRNGKDHRKQVENFVTRAKADILERVGKAQDMTEAEYGKVVDQVISKYEAAKEVTKERAAEVGDKFKRGWEDIRETARYAAQEARDQLAREDTRVMRTEENRT